MLHYLEDTQEAKSTDYPESGQEGIITKTWFEILLGSLSRPVLQPGGAIATGADNINIAFAPTLDFTVTLAADYSLH